ncbi:unnamed protein product [Closterium sp. NIES-54]
MAAAKRVLRYLCSTSGMGLVLGGRRPVVLTGHADASWADDQATQRSSQGYTFSLGSGSELRWLTYLLTDLGEQPCSPPVLYVDNKAMLALCREHRLEHRTKHIALRYFLARELQQRGQLRLAYVASEANTAYIFTKALAPDCVVFLLKLRQIAVANAFLYAPVDAEIFVELPHGSNADPNQVCQLEKSLYNIKQASRLWRQHLHARLIRIGFLQLPHDQGMYRLTKGTDYILLIVYVDDLLYIGSTDAITTWFEGELQRVLTLTVATTVTQYLGLKIQDGDNAIYLSAEKYTDTIAKRFGLPLTVIYTPYRYTEGNRKVSALLKPAGIRDYQRKLGCLLFAAVTCRPDLSYSASQLATYLKKPEAEHILELDQALHYLVSTPTIGLTYHKTGTTTQVNRLRRRRSRWRFGQ